MRVLVTGGTGFIGRYVCELLSERGHGVIRFDRHRRESAYPEGELFFGDVTDDVAVTEGFAHADAFVHLAAVLGTQETIQNPRPAAISNVIGGLNVLEAASQYGTPGVYIGVGNHWMENTYSITKTTVERFVRMFNAERGTRVNVVRAMNAYGPRQVAASPYGPAKVRKITPAFVCRALCGDDVEIYGDGEQVSDMVHVRDVAKALVLACERAVAGEVLPTIEVGPDLPNTVNDVAELIVELAGSRSRIVHLPMRPGEIPGAVVSADVSTLSYVGMDPDDLVPLREGMIETVEYFKQYLSHEI